MDPDPLIESGRLEMQQIDPAELSPGEFVARIRRLVEEENLRVLVIDSMNGLLNAMPNEQFLAMQLHELFSYLGQQGIATIITLAQHGLIGTAMKLPGGRQLSRRHRPALPLFREGRSNTPGALRRQEAQRPPRTHDSRTLFGKGKVYVGATAHEF